ncbi:MAG: DUF2817 domain-containing protein [Coriobacteriia bacterium]|nr:DUF2817 domain-containing protein [Coriobacteriia bacterium]
MPCTITAKRDSAHTLRATAALLGVLAVLVAAALAAAPRASAAATTATADASATHPAAAQTTPLATGTPDVTSTPDTSVSPSQPPTRVVGLSVQGRSIVLETFGSGSRHILFVGGIHGNEYGGPVTAAFATYLRANPSVIPSGTQVDVIAYANPDGTAHGRRANAHNVDINRNFPARNWNRKRNASGSTPGATPGSEPETKALLGVLASGGYLRVISMHSRGPMIDYDGPGGWTLARRMSKASRVKVHRLPAYHGSMGSYIPEAYRTPIITWELGSRTLTGRVRAGMLAALK